MFRVFKCFVVVAIIAIVALLAYGAKGYWDALSHSDALLARAEALIARDRGGVALGKRNLEILLAVEDPGFATHGGVDFSTPGAGATTITQSASKRLAFEKFTPGIGKIRQTGYALGLESKLSKDQIMALWLDTLEMGRGPDGWMVGLFEASETLFGRPPAALNEDEFIRLTAVLIAPALYDLANGNAALAERSARIARLVTGACAPLDHGDVWLDGCR